MLAELGLRFLVGGAMVSLFAAAAEMWEPKTFAGVFGAAPSVALATLALAFDGHGSSYVATEGRSMLMGAIALAVYSAVCVAMAKRKSIPLGLGAAGAWPVWVAIALGLWWLQSLSGVL